MAASFFTEDYRLGTVSGSAGSYERRHEEEEGREEVTRFPGIVVGSASEVESEPILARYTLSFRQVVFSWQLGLSASYFPEKFFSFHARQPPAIDETLR